jgi:KUP system potassium uptake protein
VHYFKHAKTLHQKILFLTVHTQHVPEVSDAERIEDVTDYGEGLYGVKVAYGFSEQPDIPKMIAGLKGRGVDVDVNDLSFFLGRESLVFAQKSTMSLPRRVFFKFLSQNAIPASAFFKLPPGRVIELGMQIEI